MGRGQNKLCKKLCRRYIFLNMNAEFLKLRIIVAVQELKITFYMQKFSLF